MSPEPEKRIYIDKDKPYRKNLVPRGDFQSLPGQNPENPDKPETLHSLVVTQGKKLKYRSTILIQRPREVFLPTAIVHQLHKSLLSLVRNLGLQQLQIPILKKFLSVVLPLQSGGAGPSILR